MLRHCKWLSIALAGFLLLPSTILGQSAQAEPHSQGSSPKSSTTRSSNKATPKAVTRYKPNNSQAAANPSPAATGSGAHHYVNNDGKNVQSPTKPMTAPTGATAQCRDGSYSFSQHRQGTCSHHGGVARWLTN